MAKPYTLRIEHVNINEPGAFVRVTAVDAEADEEVATVEFSGQLWEMLFHSHSPVGQPREAPRQPEAAPVPRLVVPGARLCPSCGTVRGLTNRDPGFVDCADPFHRGFPLPDGGDDA